MTAPKDRIVSYCQCEGHQCIAEQGFEDDMNRPKYCKNPRWKPLRAEVACNLAFTHTRMSEWEFRGVKPLEKFDAEHQQNRQED